MQFISAHNAHLLAVLIKLHIAQQQLLLVNHLFLCIFKVNELAIKDSVEQVPCFVSLTAFEGRLTCPLGIILPLLGIKRVAVLVVSS